MQCLVAAASRVPKLMGKPNGLMLFVCLHQLPGRCASLPPQCSCRSQAKPPRTLSFSSCCTSHMDCTTGAHLQDLAVKQNLELMVERIKDVDAGVQKMALETVSKEIRSGRRLLCTPE